MAITLDELLGRNRRTQEQTSFPSFEEFRSLQNGEQKAPTFESFKDSVDSVTVDPNMPVFQDYKYRSDSVQSQSLYDFTRKDNDRLSQQELYAKLAHTNDSHRPVFDRVEVEQIVEQKHGIFTRRAVEEEAVQQETKKKGRLSVKAKLIIAAYVAVVATVVTLIVVNANKLNAGTATTPSSSISEYGIVQVIDK